MIDPSHIIDLPTKTFRSLVHVAAVTTGTTLHESWTDYRNDGMGPERIVTYSFTCLKGWRYFMRRLEGLMEVAGLETRSHGLRVTDSGYLKCNCVI